MDETDSGLDIDALKHVSRRSEQARRPERRASCSSPTTSASSTTSGPTTVHVLIGGRIVESGGFELAERLEAEGYAGLAKELGLAEEEVAEVEAARERKGRSGECCSRRR